MACPLLERLAPETRNLIYEYVLTFDTPFKHAQKMRPFINKLYERSDSGTGTTSGAASSHMADSLQRVDTALLSTSRLIYKEAVVAFYKNNVICFDADGCEAASIVSPRATDLSLATQVMMKITGGYDTAKSLSAFHEGIEFSQEAFPAIFSKLRTATIYIYTDSCMAPVEALFALADYLHSSPNHDDIVFEGVGSFTAHSVNQPHISTMVQCKKTVEGWAKAELGLGSLYRFEMSTKSRYPYSQDGHVHRDAIRSFNVARRSYLPDSYPEVAEGSFEFWTVVDEVWQRRQLMMQGIQDIVSSIHFPFVQRVPSTTQPNDASSKTNSSSDSGGEDDASISPEHQPESELDAADDGADDQTS